MKAIESLENCLYRKPALSPGFSPNSQELLYSMNSNNENDSEIQMEILVPIILALGRLILVDCCEFEDSLVYIRHLSQPTGKDFL